MWKSGGFSTDKFLHIAALCSLLKYVWKFVEQMLLCFMPKYSACMGFVMDSAFSNNVYGMYELWLIPFVISYALMRWSIHFPFWTHVRMSCWNNICWRALWFRIYVAHSDIFSDRLNCMNFIIIILLLSLS